MSTLFSVGSGSAYLTVLSAAGGAATLQVPNPDLSVTSVSLTAAQLRQLGNAAGFAIATNTVAVPIVATIAGIVVTSPPRITPDSFNPPVTGINLAVPLSGTGAGQTYTQYLTYLQTEQMFNALSLYSVTNQ
jgi:hypothetical protein